MRPAIAFIDMLIQNMDLPNFQAMARLVRIQLANGVILQGERLQELVYLATDHGISREEAEELIVVIAES